MTEKSPTTLPKRYRLQSLIGRGGMGSVYRARDEALGRDVAIKILPASTDEFIARSQEDEVNVLAGLSHHSLVTLFDAGMDRSNPEQPRVYLVMELVSGTDLQRTLALGRLSTRRIAQMGYDVSEGLQYIHHRGVVHRDIKPANILIVDYSDDSTRTRAKLTDFGVAIVRGAERAESKATTAGTAAYLSPEQAAREPIGTASDIYSFGLVLLECFTGVVAFPGEILESTKERLLRGPDIPATIPVMWRDLITAMTARDPAERPAASDLVHLFREAVVVETSRHKSAATTLRPSVEDDRLQAVARYDILDSPPDAAFDRITALAARILKVPVAIVSVVDRERVWFKSVHGIDATEVTRDPGLCASAITGDEPWIVEDARTDPRTRSHPMVTSDPGVRFYAGIPLRMADGHNLGTMCVLDYEPRVMSDDDLSTLTDLAAMVMNELELRIESRRARAAQGRPPARELVDTVPITIADLHSVGIRVGKPGASAPDSSRTLTDDTAGRSQQA